MGNSESGSIKSPGKSNDASYSTCTSRGASGLNEYCYNTGYDHGRGMSLTDPDPVGEGISALPCRTNDRANQCYTKGYTDGLSGRSVGVSVRENYEDLRRDNYEDLRREMRTNRRVRGDSRD